MLGLQGQWRFTRRVSVWFTWKLSVGVTGRVGIWLGAWLKGRDRVRDTGGVRVVEIAERFIVRHAGMFSVRVTGRVSRRIIGRVSFSYCRLGH